MRVSAFLNRVRSSAYLQTGPWIPTRHEPAFRQYDRGHSVNHTTDHQCCRHPSWNMTPRHGTRELCCCTKCFAVELHPLGVFKTAPTHPVLPMTNVLPCTGCATFIWHCLEDKCEVWDCTVYYSYDMSMRGIYRKSALPWQLDSSERKGRQSAEWSQRLSCGIQPGDPSHTSAPSSHCSRAGGDRKSGLD